MTRWQYCILTVLERGESTINFCDGKGRQPVQNNSADVLRDLGLNGWELVSAVNRHPMEMSIAFLFKRPIP